MALQELEYAYHVTNIEDDSPQPDWSHLKCNDAVSQQYDGALYLKKCVFFNTTLYKGELPTRSQYPRDADEDSTHWRVKVPINEFDEYKIWFIHEEYAPNSTVKQVLLVMARPQDESGMEFLRAGVPANTITDNVDIINQYLRRFADEQTGIMRYRGNDYDDDMTFVTIAVFHDFPLNVNCHWDLVAHM